MCEYRSCRVPAEPGERLCILHLASPKDVNRFKEILYPQIDETGSTATRNDRFGFEGYHFPAGISIGDVSARKISPDVILPDVMESCIFIDARIEGNVALDGVKVTTNVVFEGATIAGGANLSRASVEGGVFFSEARIEGDVFFNSAWIKGDVRFDRASIGRTAVFDRTIIEGDLFFNWAMIRGYALFDSARIEGDVLFNSAAIDDDTYFSGASIRGNAYFKGVSIGGDLNLADAELMGRADFTLCRAGGLSMGVDRPTTLWFLRNRYGLRIPDPATAFSFWKFARRQYEETGERAFANASHHFERVWRWKAIRHQAWLHLRESWR